MIDNVSTVDPVGVRDARRVAFRFIVSMGILSFFADFTYEGSAAVSPMVATRPRALAFGTFTAGYRVFWFLGSAVIGIPYDASVPAVIAFCVVTQLAAVPVFIWVGRRPHAQNRA